MRGWGSGFRPQGLGFRFWIQGVRLGVSYVGLRVLLGSGFRIQLG